MASVYKDLKEIHLVDPVRRIKTTPLAPCTEYTPLIGRPSRKGTEINFRLLSLGILLIGGLTIGSYLLMKDNRPYPITLVFDMVDRVVWNAMELPIGLELRSSDVRNIYVMQTNSIECHNYIDCVTILRKMQTTANETLNAGLPYNFLIGGDGETYEARGFSEQSGFSFVPQNSSLTIGVIGTFDNHPPPDSQLSETYALIFESLRRHKIIQNYRIFGIRNLTISATDSQALLNKISNWDHWNSTTNSLNLYLVRDYLKYNNVQIALLLTCENMSEIFEISRDLHNDNVYVNTWTSYSESDLFKFNFTKFFARLENPIAVVTHLNCEQINSMMEQLSQRTLFHLERMWLIFANNLSQSFEILAHQNINMDAEVTLVIPQAEDEYRISDVYNPSFKRGGKLNIIYVGTWNQYDGIRIINQQTKIERRRDLGGLTFHSVITLPSPFPNNQTLMEHIDSSDYTSVNSLDRSVYKLFQLMMDMYNFKLLIHHSTYWSGTDSNGSLTGSIGMVYRQEVDVCLCGLRQTNERYEIIELTSSCYSVQLSFIFRHPKSDNTSNVYLTPFDRMVWLALIIIGLFISIVVRQSFLIESTDCTYSNSILMVFGIIFQQGYGGSTFFFSSRIFTITTLVFSIIIFQFYSSFILSSILTEPPKTIKTINQLRNSKLEIALDNVPYILDNLKHAKDEDTKKLYQKIVKSSNVIISTNEGLDKVRKGGFAFNTDLSYAYLVLKSLLTDKQVCELQEVQYTQNLLGYPAIHKKSPLRELIKISVRKFTETGLMSHHWKIWIGQKPKCHNSEVDIMPVDFKHFSSAIYLLIIGIQISVGILLIEMGLNYISKRTC